MKNLLIAFTCVSVTACAPAYYKSTSQNYRPLGEKSTIKIDGGIVHQKNLLSDDYAVVFKINDETPLYFQLDNGGNGSLSCTSEIGSKESKSLFYCTPHNGKPIGANCIGSTANGRLISTQCAFTYDNEIAANFRF